MSDPIEHGTLRSVDEYAQGPAAWLPPGSCAVLHADGRRQLFPMIAGGIRCDEHGQAYLDERAFALMLHTLGWPS